jgi:hypothetical protein
MPPAACARGVAAPEGNEEGREDLCDLADVRSVVGQATEEEPTGRQSVGEVVDLPELLEERRVSFQEVVHAIVKTGLGVVPEPSCNNNVRAGDWSMKSPNVITSFLEKLNGKKTKLADFSAALRPSP